MKKPIFIFASAVAFLALLLTSLVTRVSYSLPALAAVPTPLPYGITVDTATSAPWYDRTRVTADGRICLGTLARYNWAEVQYVVDEGSPTNAITLTMQHSNDGRTFEDGAVVLATGSVDTHAMVRVPLMGRQNCVRVDVANTNAVTVTAYGNVK